jgi:anthranilate 1,2-dioxygenase small subunit
MSDAAMREAAEDLMDDYAQLLDAGQLDEWLELFTEDAIYQVLSRENVEQQLPAALIWCENKRMLCDRVVSLQKANEYNLHYARHLISRVRVRADEGAVWRLEASYAVFQTTLEGQTRLFSVGKYADKVRYDDGKLKFSEKTVVVDTFSVPTLLATPL